MTPEPVEVKLVCQGPCGKGGKTLYPIFITEKEGEDPVEKMYCTDCTEEHDKLVAEVEREIINKDRILENKISSNIPKTFEDMIFDDYVSDPVKLKDIFSKGERNSIIGAKEIVMEFADAILAGESEMIGLLGKYGTGKTLLACIVGNEVVKAGGKAKMEKAGLLCRKLMNNEEYESIIVKLAENDLLIIDDISSAALTDFTRKSLSDVIDFVKESQKSLIITSNSTVSDI